VTTILRRQEKQDRKNGQSRSVRDLDSFEIIPNGAGSPTGVPRSTWFRTKPASRWYLAYALLLLLLDYAAALLASLTAIMTIERASSGFQNDESLFRLTAYLLLPGIWLLILWSYGGYDRRWLGVGTDEF